MDIPTILADGLTPAIPVVVGGKTKVQDRRTACNEIVSIRTPMLPNMEEAIPAGKKNLSSPVVIGVAESESVGQLDLGKVGHFKAIGRSDPGEVGGSSSRVMNG
jgi:hypothetical protein